MTTPPETVLATAASGPAAPSFRVRVLMAGRELAESGIEIHARPFFSAEDAGAFATAGWAAKARLLGRARRRLLRQVGTLPGRTVMVSRQADFLPSLQLERSFVSGRRLVYDVDDAIWYSGSPAAGGHRLAVLKGSQAKAKWLAERAVVVVAGNEILAEWLSVYSAHVQIVPSLVDADAFPPRTHFDRDELVIGWIGSRSTAPFLRALEKPLQRVASRLAPRRVRLLVVGAPGLPIRGVTTESLRWSETSELGALRRIDVGVMPLPDNPWTRGKCAYKALQYMASGVPVVADDVGITSKVLDGGGAGLAVSSPQEWADAIEALAGNPARRARLGEAGRRVVLEQFSTQRWGPRLAKILADG